MVKKVELIQEILKTIYDMVKVFMFILMVMFDAVFSSQPTPPSIKV